MERLLAQILSTTSLMGTQQRALLHQSQVVRVVQERVRTFLRLPRTPSALQVTTVVFFAEYKPREVKDPALHDPT